MKSRSKDIRRRLATAVFGVLAVTAILSVDALPAQRGQAPGPQIPRMPDGKPNFTGLWQTLSGANWDLQDHSSSAGPYFQLGAMLATPAGQSVVENNQIPYRPEMLAKKRENYLNRWTLDPEIKCFMPGIPRATYMPFPFQIVQSPTNIAFAYEFATSNRVVRMTNHQKAPVPSWMGWSNGSWDGDTLVVDVTALNDQTWFDRAGNFHSDALHVIERYTYRTPDVIDYEATIEDPKVFTRPWKINLPLYRRMEKNAQLLEFKCVEYTEELIYGHLRKQ